VKERERARARARARAKESESERERARARDIYRESARADLPHTDTAHWLGLGCTPSYRGTSLIRNSAPLGLYSRTMARALWWP